VVVAVKDLFFAARFRETARLAGADLRIARSPEEITPALEAGPPDLVIVDLTTPGWDYEAVFAALERPALRPPVLGFTTHALARETQPWHARCRRVMTKETLTRELGRILTEGLAA
jgi:DNA-binding NtrC family response regulator